MRYMVICVALVGCTDNEQEKEEDNCDNPGTWYADIDEDGFGDSDNSISGCEQPTGYLEKAGDCDDTNGEINPDAEEYCDYVDNNCNGLADEQAEDAQTWFLDADSDGYGNPDSTISSCDQPEGYTAIGEDCADGDPSINPDSPEICDGMDNDCNGMTDGEDEALDLSTTATFYSDTDGDGFGDPDNPITACDQPEGTVADMSDCNDNDSDTHPESEEICDGTDNDCDGVVDPDCDGVVDPDSASDAPTWYGDSDGDGFGNPNASSTACSQPIGAVSDMTDCDDGQNSIHPQATEVCDSIDNDCDGLIDDSDPNLDASTGIVFHADSDGDGYGDLGNHVSACTQPEGMTENSLDCDDSDGAINPGAMASTTTAMEPSIQLHRPMPRPGTSITMATDTARATIPSRPVPSRMDTRTIPKTAMNRMGFSTPVSGAVES